MEANPDRAFLELQAIGGFSTAHSFYIAQDEHRSQIGRERIDGLFEELPKLCVGQIVFGGGGISWGRHSCCPGLRCGKWWALELLAALLLPKTIQSAIGGDAREPTTERRGSRILMKSGERGDVGALDDVFRFSVVMYDGACDPKQALIVVPHDPLELLARRTGRGLRSGRNGVVAVQWMGVAHGKIHSWAPAALLRGATHNSSSPVLGAQALIDINFSVAV